ncbi:hypothetical protein UlMin_035519 [Ulmus minor]
MCSIYRVLEPTSLGGTLDDYIEMIRQKEELLCSCFVEPIGFTSDEFVKIVLVDAAFIIEVLLRFSQYLKDEHNSQILIDEHDWIFNKQRILKDIFNDLLLLENQLPFFIFRLSIFDLSYKLFKVTMKVEGTEDKLRRLRGRICHFVDFLRSLYVPSSRSGGTINTLTMFPRVTELYKAGVKFKVGSSGNLFDFQFSKGVLEIPNDYVVMMDCLVDTPKDFGLLVKYRIIENRLGDNAEVSTLINRLEYGLKFYSNDFYFAKFLKSSTITMELHGTNGRPI